MTARRGPAARWRSGALGAFGGLLMLAAAACRQDMHDNPRSEPLEASPFFPDGRASRPPVEGTVPRGGLREDDRFYRGKSGAGLVTELPLPVTLSLLARGRERYDIFCAPCHDRVGNGLGMVVRRGYRRPPSLHDERLRQSPPGYLYDVITSGFGSMPDYASQIAPEDRWAIVAYMRALQLSQRAALGDVPAAERGTLEAPPGAPAARPSVSPRPARRPGEAREEGHR